VKLIFATNNQHKVEEIRAELPANYQVITLKEAGIDIDIPEPYDTLEENAAEKCNVIFEKTKTACFGEDTGLEVYAVNYEPGVKSARYAGEQRSSQQNIEKLLIKLEGVQDRSARFRTVICLRLAGEQQLFEGVCEGKIIRTPMGRDGFGYDPVFVPTGSHKTFAEMDMAEKNSFSHRSKAVHQLVNFLNSLDKNMQT
jgi:XTP/dITP diphosphohydrolase